MIQSWSVACETLNHKHLLCLVGIEQDFEKWKEMFWKKVFKKVVEKKNKKTKDSCKDDCKKCKCKESGEPCSSEEEVSWL